MNFEPVIGIEVHVELSTDNKMFSMAPVNFNDAPNTNVNEVDLGMPGALPTVNAQGVEYGIKLANALNCNIEKDLIFDRKHYFYYDNAKGYQITQHQKPIGQNGYIELLNGKKIEIKEIHLEEDTAKTTNVDDGALIDFNRGSVPLIEIVSGTNITNAKEASEYLELLKVIVQNLNVSDAKMEEGSLRVDVNVSIRPKGYDKFNTKVEIKNINSFSNVVRAIDFEINRQSELYLKNETLKQETRGFDDKKRITVLQRVKETKDDYFYIPETDIFPIEISDEFVTNSIDKNFKTPFEKFNEYKELLKDESLAKYFILNNKIAQYFEASNANCNDSLLLANMIKSEIISVLEKNNLEINNDLLTPSRLCNLINNVSCGKISTSQAKKLIGFIIKENKDVDVLIKEKQMEQISDPNVLLPIINEVLDNNEQSIIDFKNGKDRALKALMGQCMKVTKGKANPKILNQLVAQELNKR